MSMQQTQPQDATAPVTIDGATGEVDTKATETNTEATDFGDDPESGLPGDVDPISGEVVPTGETSTEASATTTTSAKGGRTPSIPKDRFDEVNERRKAAESEAAELRARIAALEAAQKASAAAAPPARDFETEFNALAQKYEDGDIDRIEYDKAYRELVKAEVQHQTITATAQAAVMGLQEAQKSSWNEAATTWTNENAEFMANPIRANAMREAIKMVDDGKMTNEEVLAKAQQVAFEAFNWSGGQATPDPRALTASKRGAESAIKAAAASTAPPLPVAGAGNRTTVSAVDTSDISREDWMKLTPEQKERALA